MDEKQQKLMFSSGKDDWETPDDLFKEWDEIRGFYFDLDVCANSENKKVISYFDENKDGLSQRWHGNCWCNPPYSKSKFWIKKAYDSAIEGTATTVMLIPARTDTKAFHQYIYKKSNVEIEFIKGRLQFKGAKYKAPFPSMIVIFNKV